MMTADESVEKRQMLSTRSASVVFGISPGYVATLVRCGKVSGQRMEKGWQVDADSLEQYLLAEKTGESRMKYARHLSSRACQASEEGAYELAVGLYSRAIAIVEGFRDMVTFQSAALRIDLANLYLKHDQPADAEELLLEPFVDKIYSEQLFSPLRVKLLDHLVLLYVRQGRLADAESGLREQLALLEKQSGVTAEERVRVQANLALVLMRRESYVEIARLFPEAYVREVVPILGVESRLGLLAVLLQAAVLQEDHERAQWLFAQNREAFPTTASEIETIRDPMLLHTIAEIYRSKQEYEQAEPVYVRALALARHQFGQGDSRIGVIYTHLAQLYHAQRKYSHAEENYLQAIQIAEAVHGAKHPETVSVVHDLATLYLDQKKDQDVESSQQGDPLTFLQKAMRTVRQDPDLQA